MNSILWSQQAGRDRDSAFSAAFRLGIDDAETLLEKLAEAENFLTRTPFGGPPLLNGERRKWRLGHLPYALIYRVDGDRLYILRLIHLRTDWQSII